MQYRRRDSLMRLYELGRSFTDQIIKEMETCGRYPEDTVLRGGKYVRVNEDDFRDYLLHRDRLKDPTTGKLVPAYQRPNETIEDIYIIRR